MSKKLGNPKDSFVSIFNKNFFGLLSGFLVLIFTGLVFVFFAGYYKSEMGNSKAFDVQTPGKEARAENSRNSSSVEASMSSASSTKSRLNEDQ